MNVQERLQVAADTVEMWRAATGTSRPVEPGSSLAADDAAFPLNPVSHLVWFGISHAVDHLDMYLHVLVRSGHSFPIAPQTLARGGLIGAAHALWMLDAPDRRTRQLRGLKIAHEEWRNERTAYQELVESGEAVAGMDNLVVVRGEWMAEAVAAGESIGWTAADVRARPNDTKLIEDVLTRYESRDPAEPGMMTMPTLYTLLWRMLSGSAHAYRWSSMGRIRFAPRGSTTDSNGADGYLTTDEDQHFHSVGAMMLLINRAFELYDQRRVRHA